MTICCEQCGAVKKPRRSIKHKKDCPVWLHMQLRKEEHSAWVAGTSSKVIKKHF